MEEMHIKTRCFDLTAMDETRRQTICEAAGAVIRQGGTVVFPTETVYGLGANALNPEAVRSIYRAKGRPSDNPLIIHVADFDLTGIVREVPPQAQMLMKKYWPGPLTLILKKAPGVPDETTGSLDTVGVRMPDQPAALALIRASGTVVAAPSANISGRPSPTTYERCIQDLAGRVDVILGMDPSRVGLESTILDLSGEVPELLRPGAVTLEDLRSDLGEVRYAPSASLKEDEAPRAPGMKYRHYAPNARVTLFQGDPEPVRRHMLDRRQPDTLLIFIDANGSKEPADDPSGTVRFGSVEEAARRIFETLRLADDGGARQIWIQAVAETGLGLSLMNRLKKAAAYEIVEVKE